MMQEYLDFAKRNTEYFNNDQAMIKIILDPDSIHSWEESKKKDLADKNLPPEWSKIGIILDDPYILVIRDLVEFPSGRLGSYFRVLNQADLKEGQGVVILLRMNGKYLLLHQYRHPIRSWSYEIPRGFGEPGVPANEQAKIEVKEEIKGEITELIDLGEYHSNTGLEGNRVKLFLANLNSVGKPAAQEGIESFSFVSINEFEDMIASAKITDGFTIAAYTRAKLRGLL
ncbi:MAG: NUDIX hydrolase [Anaerolineaceae bacterium]|nr:NUDIX hydrolase [Anaerolineaceae bacterium]